MESPRKKAMESAKIIIIFGIFSKFLIFFKEALIASKIGCCFRTDSYFIAFAGINILAETIGEGITTSMIPTLMKIETKEGKDKKIDYINNILNMIILFSLMLIFILWWASPFLVKILARGFNSDELSLSLELMHLGLPMIIFILIRAIFAAYLQSNHGFKAGSKSWIYYNLVYIIYLVFFNKYGVHGLMITGVLASFSQLLLVVPASINMGYKYKWNLNFKDSYLNEMLILMMPIILGLFINRANVLIDKSVASTLAKGSVSYLNYANDIIQLVLGIFVTAIITVLFPIISEEYLKENIEDTKAIMHKGIGTIVKITIPTTLILIIFSEPIVRLFFERGVFGPRVTKITSEVLVYYAMGLTSMAMILILTKLHYAIYDTRTPTMYGIVGVIINLILDIVLSKYMGISGIALATSISMTIVVVLLIIGLNKRLNEI